jgi:hypothetical protein
MPSIPSANTVVAIFRVIVMHSRKAFIQIYRLQEESLRTGFWIFEPKREVIGGWRKLHNELLHNLYSSPSIIRIIKSRRMRLAGHVARMRAKRNAYSILVKNPEGKRPLGRPRRRWVDNIKMDLREIGWDGMDWIDMA